MNKKFESIAIVKSSIGEERAKDCFEKVKMFLKENGILDYAEFMGKRKLAYQINKNNEAYYIHFIFENKDKADLVTSLENLYRKDDDILKFIVMGIEESNIYEELRNKIHNSDDSFTSLEKAMAYLAVNLAEKNDQEITFENVRDISYSLSNNFTLNEFIEDFIENELSKLKPEEEEDSL